MIRTITIVILFLFVANGLSAQVNQTFIGSWTVSVSRIIERMSPTEKVKYETMSLKARERMTSMLQGRVFHFREDNQLEIRYTSQGQEKTINGQWTYSDISNELQIKINEISQYYHIQWYTENSIHMAFDKTTSQDLFTSLYLERNN